MTTECGNGPFRLKLTVWREGEHAYFDWTGTSPQAPGPVNFYLHEGMFKMFIGVYMIMVFDPQILFNDGFYDIIHVTLPKGSLLHPDFPAPLGSRTHALARQFDVLGGALSRNAPGDGDRRRIRVEPALPLLGTGLGGACVPAHGDPLRRHPRPAGRGWHGRALVVASFREHPFRVPRELLPDAHRRLPLHSRYRRTGSAPGRKRGGEGLPTPRGGRGVHPRRPPPLPAVGHPGGTARRLLREVAGAGRWQPRADTFQGGQRAGGAGRSDRVPDRGRGAAGGTPSSATRRWCAATWCAGSSPRRRPGRATGWR